MSVFTSGKGWTQITAQKKTGQIAAAGDDPKGEKGYSRLAKYGRDRLTTFGWEGEL